MRIRLGSPSFGFAAILSFLSGCFDPSAQVESSGQFPTQPPPDKPYDCGISTGATCAKPRASFWVPGWFVSYIAARDDKAAFIAYSTSPTGGVKTAEPQHLGQFDLEKGTLDWVIKLGTTNAIQSILEKRISSRCVTTPRGSGSNPSTPTEIAVQP